MKLVLPVASSYSVRIFPPKRTSLAYSGRFNSNGFPLKLTDYIDFFIIENVSSEGRMSMKGNHQESHFKAVTLLKKMIPAKDYREVKESIEYTIGY